MSSEMTSHDPLSNDDGFWGLLLGKKYDKVPESERTLENLVSNSTLGVRNVSTPGLSRSTT